MKSWIPTKSEWEAWGKLERCGYVGFVITVISLVLTAASLIDLSKTSKNVVELKSDIEQLTSTEVHVLPRDIEFDLDYYKENTSVLLHSSLSFQARVAPVLMTNKAELLDFNLDENYFSPQDFDRSIAIKKVTVDAISLEKISEVALITITFDTKFVYVNSHDIVWNIERIRDKIVGYAKIRLFYIFNGVEKTTDICIPIRFV
ncbi:hypothetical protein [Vibrio parahaemolyticus]|uniref:hypothetical protein n=1 Tax=Vibrio parahaemolyticus TaxID=670 RepID=UPI00235FD046|nr:hypothetical protein [Vibrio parahaemolyticus]